MPARRLDDVQAADVVRRYESGETIDQLASAFGVSSSPVRKAIVDAGVPFRTKAARARALDAAQAEGVVDRYRNGETIDELAAAFDVSSTAVRTALTAADASIRPRSHKPIPLDVDELVARFDAGETMSSIARDLDVDVNTIRRRLLKAGRSTPGRGWHR